MTEQRTITHWRVSAAVCMMLWGTCFIYDIPAALSVSLADHMSLSDHQYAYFVSILYAVYSVPNTVLPFLSGTAVARFGERTLLLATTASIIVGQLLFALGVQTRSQIAMIGGRACIGLGGEVVSVLGYEITTRWFQDGKLSLALAMNLSAGRLGSVANSMLTPRMVGVYGVVAATWTGTVLFLAICGLSAVSLINLEPSANTKTKEKNINTAVSFRHFPPVYWHLALICFLGYGCINTFTNSAQRFLATTFYHGDQPAAGSAMSISFILSGTLVTPLGYILDTLLNTKCKSPTSYARAVLAGNILLVLVHSIFLTGAASRASPAAAPRPRPRLSPILPLCLLGIGEAIFGVAFWAGLARCPPLSGPGAHTYLSEEWGDGDMCWKREREPILSRRKNVSVSVDGYGYLERGGESEPESESFQDPDTETETETGRVVRHDALRTLGLGIMASLMNLSTAVMPVVLAVVEDGAGFEGVEGVFLGLGVLGVLVSVRLVWMWD